MLRCFSFLNFDVNFFLEKLSRKAKEFYSIRINDQWGIVFKWNVGNASEVEIIDYH